MKVLLREMKITRTALKCMIGSSYDLWVIPKGSLRDEPDGRSIITTAYEADVTIS
jgi:hypothetical protein